jgi:hypothetical protein
MQRQSMSVRPAGRGHQDKKRCQLCRACVSLYLLACSMGRNKVSSPQQVHYKQNHAPFFERERPALGLDTTENIYACCTRVELLTADMQEVGRSRSMHGGHSTRSRKQRGEWKKQDAVPTATMNEDCHHVELWPLHPHHQQPDAERRQHAHPRLLSATRVLQGGACPTTPAPTPANPSTSSCKSCRASRKACVRQMHNNNPKTKHGISHYPTVSR